MSITQNVTGRKLSYNNFNLDHTFDFSGRIGKLIPVQAMPVVAGDLVDESIEFNIRLSPLSAPAMARFNVHFHSFYVPYRILTPRNGQETTWEKFVLSVTDPTSHEGATLPHFRTYAPLSIGNLFDSTETFTPSFDSLSIGSLWDYLKLPTLPSNVNDDKFFFIDSEALGVPGFIAFNFLAYLKIWNDWYRRDQIEEEVVFPLNLGKIELTDFSLSEFVEPELPKNVTTPFDINNFCHELMKLRTRNYERDYFTSALPEPQLGDDVFLSGGELAAATNAMISLSSSEPIGLSLFKNPTSSSLDGSDIAPLWESPNSLPAGPYYLTGRNLSSDTYANLQPGDEFGGVPMKVNSVEGIYSTPFSINELRLAMQIQGVREKINRGGTRYVEVMKSIHGVTVSDLRLQRPQYLGGLKAPISIGAVLQTSESGTTPQGTPTGVGGTASGGHLFRTKRIFEEAGVLMTIMSITPRTGYFGGVERQYLKFDPLDYYTPDFDHLGEQETYRAELHYNPVYLSEVPDETPQHDNLKDDKHFGYNPRYEEYKASYSSVAGEFRTTLDNWNVYREFDAPPTLSPEFIHAESEDFDRIFMFEDIESTSNEHFQCQLFFNIKAKRPMSKYSTPFTFF